MLILVPWRCRDDSYFLPGEQSERVERTIWQTHPPDSGKIISIGFAARD